MSTLEHFFKPASGAGSSSSTAVPVSAFLAAQKEVAKKMEKIVTPRKKCGSYALILEELKVKVAKNAAENGVSSPLRHFKSTQDLELKESTVRSWVTTYQKRLDSLHKEGKPVTMFILSERILSAMCLPAA